MEGCTTFNQSAACLQQVHAHSPKATTMILLRDEDISMDTERFLFLTTRRQHEHQPEPQYLVVFSIVVPAEGVESPHLHPTTAQLLTGVIKESTDVRSDL